MITADATSKKTTPHGCSGRPDSRDPGRSVPPGTNGDVRAVFDRWTALKRGVPCRPCRHRPARPRPYLPGIMLVDVVDDSRRYVYRLVGTREVAMRGNDPTGRAVAEGYFAPTADAAIASFQDVVDRRAPRFENRRFIAADGRVGDEECVILPLSNDGSRVNMLLVYTHHRMA